MFVDYALPGCTPAERRTMYDAMADTLAKLHRVRTDRMGNLMFDPREPRVVAVLDRELSTLGSPLADVAFNAMAWRSLPSEYGGLLGLDLDSMDIPDEASYLTRYSALAGRTEPVLPDPTPLTRE